MFAGCQERRVFMIVYKYLDEEGTKNVLDGKSVLLNTPSNFNDSYDSKIYISKKERQKAFRLFINYQFFKIFYNESVINDKQLILGKLNTKLLKSNLILSANSIKAKKRYKYDYNIAFYSKLTEAFMQKRLEDCIKEFNCIIDKTLNEIRNAILISCFSLKNNSILMWSHYAASHAGACIEFEINDNNFKKVKYSKKPVCLKLSKLFEFMFGHEFTATELKYTNDIFKFAIKPFLTKYKDWKYEKEARCGYSINSADPNIYNNIGKNGKPIKLLRMPGTIKAVYLGCKASDSFADEVKEKSRGCPVYKMKSSDDRYKLIVEKCL